MTKLATKVELDGKIIFTKPISKEDNLVSIRGLIKERIDSSFIFLDQEGNTIDKNDEKDFKLEDIVDGKIMRLKSEGGGKSDNNSLKVLLGDKNFCSINCNKTENVSKARQLIKDKCKEDFIFLDSEGNNIEQEDEKDLAIEDILINEVIKIKLKDSSAPTLILEDNKPKSNEKNTKTKKNKVTNFLKYEILKKRNDLTIYKYSNLERVSNHPLVYQYFYDKYNAKDYSDAYIVLFCGKTGDGKSTAINAFFNIIKGVELHDDYRFILITEPKKDKGQAVSQTDGVHLYYLKDYDNKPIIIIDSQGYGDTRGKKYDEMVNDAFKFVFSNVIDHINTVCFISKSNTNRLDILTRYIFSSVTSLFSEDISENFIVTSTFATKETIETGPAFIESIQTDADFLKIQNRLNEKWWYAFDSKNVLDNEEDKLTIYSIKQLNELYEEKVKKLRPKSVKKCAEVLETRKELKVQVNLLSDTFENLLIEQVNLQEKEKVINDISLKIIDMETRISNFERDAQTLDPKELEKRMEELNEEVDSKLNELNYNRNKLNQEKINNINDRNEIQKKILDTKNQITFIIVRLKNISNKINDIAMNNNHLKTEEEYIDSLEDNMKEIGIKDEEQKRILQEQKDCIKVFRETNKLDDKELMKLDDSQLAEKLKIIIPKSKKDIK
jgi:hypothetical protein